MQGFPLLFKTFSKKQKKFCKKIQNEKGRGLFFSLPRTHCAIRASGNKKSVGHF
jgi:hypothetical protein